MIQEVLGGYFVDFGETVTVAGTDITAIFDGGYAETQDAAGVAPSIFCISSDVAAAVVGDSVVRDGTSYVIRNILPEPPDEVTTRLILELQ